MEYSAQKKSHAPSRKHTQVTRLSDLRIGSSLIWGWGRRYKLRCKVGWGRRYKLRCKVGRGRRYKLRCKVGWGRRYKLRCKVGWGRRYNLRCKVGWGKRYKLQCTVKAESVIQQILSWCRQIRWVVAIYSDFKKACRIKCTRQPRKVLWVVLSSLFFKEIWKNSRRDHGHQGSASAKGKQQN